MRRQAKKEEGGRMREHAEGVAVGESRKVEWGEGRGGSKIRERDGRETGCERRNQEGRKGDQLKEGVVVVVAARLAGNRQGGGGGGGGEGGGV